ncbi:MAG: type II toxin-antitoxin system prevent-host-death family antitoxin [Sulfuritalea sp.]|nr:type II toxin-antitoxin system prevent-host-death family antitoxin [Sulfuritalea sp.]MDP1983665.1 type II toxin-antitoxin system prevent-host-death family antitoxin [Sulfuritalea sp.]
MLSVGIFEAKAQLSQLVERVAQGEEVLVTRHGKPVARLVAPEASSDVSALAEWTADLRSFRRGIDRGAKLGKGAGSSSAELIAAGRR